MLTAKQINEVSFGKAGFSGYKPEDVDVFIDRVEETVTQLENDKKSADRTIAELTARNNELQEKLAVLAEKVESYRSEEDKIKDAIISAQRLSSDSINDAKQKAGLMLKDAKEEANKTLTQAQSKSKELIENAEKRAKEVKSKAEKEADEIMKKAIEEASKAAGEYIKKSGEKKKELEEVQKQVTAFRSSLLEMYKKHLEAINHIPIFNLKEKGKADEKDTEEKERAEREEKTAKITISEDIRQQIVGDRAEEESAPIRVVEHPVREPRKQSRPPEALAEKRNFTQEETLKNDLSYAGIDTMSYSDIPQQLKEEKRTHFNNLKFGDDVDIKRM